MAYITKVESIYVTLTHIKSELHTPATPRQDVPYICNMKYLAST